ncbi:MAG: sensor domain-containing diguanylate cyclase, partial [Longimicrobiales bacterium]|nr:sensor domain-containing diguanylate cyclase [Longimicrobiales bacterium]
LVDEDRQWFKSRSGLETEETPRALSFCSHAIQGDDIMVVPDASADARFQQNPLVQGDPNIRFYAACPVRAPDGSKLGTICVIDHEPRELAADDADLLRDLAELVENEFRALELATVDDLTGLTNRRGFHAIAYHSLALCQRVGKPAALLMFDLDDFKEINDTRGHAAGDRVLRRFADQLLTSFRDSDVVARLGGDEFCVLLSGASAQEAPNALAHLDDSLQGDGVESPIRYSVGVIEYDPEKHPNVATLLEEADRRMYQDKGDRKRDGGRKNTGRA